MNPITRDEILPLGEYERVREHFRSRVIAEKKLRRVALGPNMTLVFESHDSALMQVQEMLRTERITREAAILHEIETYNDLVPGDAELSATVMIEIEDKETRERFLKDAKGVEDAFAFNVAGHICNGAVREDRRLDDRASAVIYLKFPLTPGAREAILGRKDAEITVSHAAYKAAVALPAALRESLAADLAP